MSEQDKNDSSSEVLASEVLMEKVRELEAQKQRELEEAERLEQRRNTAKILGEKIHLSPPMSDEEARRTMGKFTRRNFLIGAAAAAVGGAGYWWLRQPEQAGVFTNTFRFNEGISQRYYSPTRLAPEFSPENITGLRVNGAQGMSEGFDPEKWRLQVLGVAEQEKYSQYRDDISYDAGFKAEAAPQEAPEKDAKGGPAVEQLTSSKLALEKIPGLLLTLDDIKALPRVEMITELKCIEGWSAITHWAGVRFSDFVTRFKPSVLYSAYFSLLSSASDNLRPPGTNPGSDATLVPYVSLITPDGGYYVGMDMQSMLHPQTLLCYEMNFAPLTISHGAPLRLVTPTKYGIKQIKRIGRIIFTDERPKDFWAESGYDWYSGH